MRDMIKDSALVLAEKIKCGEIKIAEVLDAVYESEEQNKELNCFITLCRERAYSKGSEIQKRIDAGEYISPLAGVPIGIKDNIAVKDVKMTCGSHMLENYVPPVSAAAVEKLEEAGLIIVGKLNMDEFAMGSTGETSYYGAVLNPVDKTRVPGGSSSGAAAAVAAGIIPLALGSDTGGSVRQPAAFCGIVGVKPTYGRVSRYGLVAFASSLDQIGPMTQTVEDAAILLQAISGHDRKDSTSANCPVPDFEAALGRDVKGLKVGIPSEYFTSGNHPGISEAVQNTVKQLENLGAELVEVNLPHADAVVAAYYIIACAEASSNLSRFDGVRYGKRAEDAAGLVELFSRTREEGFGPEVKRRIILGTYVLSSGYYDAYYSRAQKVRSLVARDFAEAFSRADIIVGPTSPAPAPKIGDSALDHLQTYLADIYTIPANLAGLPAMSIPCGTVRESGMELPVGFQMMAPHFREDLLLKTGFALGK